MAPPVRTTLGHSIELLHQRSELGTNVRARLSLPAILRPYLPQPAPLTGQPHARERHRIQANRQCFLEMRSSRSPARTRQLAHPSRSGDLWPKVADALHALLHCKRARACRLQASASRKSNIATTSSSTAVRHWIILANACSMPTEQSGSRTRSP